MTRFYIFCVLPFLVLLSILPSYVSVPCTKVTCKCRAHEVRTLYSVQRECEPHCLRVEKALTVCAKQFLPGCICQPDWIYADKFIPICIPEKYCPRANEDPSTYYFSPCKADCQARCECLRPTNQTARDRCHCDQRKCVPGYACRRGLARDLYGYCRRIKDCTEGYKAIPDTLLPPHKRPKIIGHLMIPCEEDEDEE